MLTVDGLMAGLRLNCLLSIKTFDVKPDCCNIIYYSFATSFNLFFSREVSPFSLVKY